MTGSNDRKPSKVALMVRPGYEVGYAKPPEATRFQRGQSGNPRGRPKGARNKRPALNDERMKTLVLEEAYRQIEIRDGTRTLKVPIAQAVLRAIAVNAVKGQHRSQRLFAELVGQVEASNRALAEAFFGSAIDYKQAWDRELRRRDVLGIRDLPPPLPHPDHIILDANRGTVKIVGPKTQEEKAVFDEAYRELRRITMMQELCREALESEDDPAERAELEESIAVAARTIQRYRQVLPESHFPVVVDDQFRDEMEAWKRENG
jgi:hypothetical protein